MPISTKTDQTSLANRGGVVSAVLNINVRQSGNQEFQLFVLDGEFPQILSQNVPKKSVNPQLKTRVSGACSI